MTTLTSASSSSLSPSSIQSLMRALILSTKMVFSKWPYVAIAGVVATGFWIIFNVFDQLLFFSPVLFFYLPGAHRKYECICARTIKEAEGGLEIVGELNDFVRESIKEFYHNIDENHDVRILLVNSQDRILPEVSEDLGAHWS